MATTAKTESELLFEDFCRRAAIRCERIRPSERDGEQSPDYQVWLGNQRVIVEVKQFDPNVEERKAAEAMERGEVVVLGPGAPGGRIRNAIRKAAPQLKALSDGELPTMVVVYNNTVCSLHTTPEAVSFAMDGIEVVPVLVPHDPNAPPIFQDPRSGPKKMLTTKHNTTVSAVGVLRTNWDDTPALLVYHNRHAKHSIEPDAIRLPSLVHYRRPDGSTSGLDAWEDA